jgi:hypothetical protein
MFRQCSGRARLENDMSDTGGYPSHNLGVEVEADVRRSSRASGDGNTI